MFGHLVRFLPNKRKFANLVRFLFMFHSKRSNALLINHKLIGRALLVHYILPELEVWKLAKSKLIKYEKNKQNKRVGLFGQTPLSRQLR
jgi:hypothetical protein